MQGRISDPTALLPGLGEGIQAVIKSVHRGGVPPATLELVHLRVSQINGCAWCLNHGFMSARNAGETDERLSLIAGWREAHCYTDAEKAALGLAEAETRIADKGDVPDDVWDLAAKYYDEKQLYALVMWIALVNLFNRGNVTTRMPADAPLG